MSRFAPALVTLVVATGCLVVMLVTLYVLALSHWHGPFRDMWEIYPFLEKIIQHSWAWQDLWESYGFAHRLFIPRLLFIADYKWSHASNHLLIIVSLLCQAGICGLFAKALFVRETESFWQRRCLLLLVVTLQFSGTLLFNFMHTFDVQWFLCCFFVTAAFFIVAMHTGKHLTTAIGSALLIAAACLCNFSAMAAWPVWLLLHYRAARPVGFWLLCAAIVAFIVVYGFGIRSSGLSALSHINIPVLMGYFLFQFPFLYLANPVSDPDYLFAGSWAAILVLAPIMLAVRFWWSFYKAKNPVDGTRVFLASLILFCFGVAVMTGLGRGYDPGHVYASRYQNIVMLFWSAGLAFVFIEAKAASLPARLWLNTSGVLLLAGLLACQWQSWNENLLLGRNVARSHLALMMGYADDVPMISATVSRSMIYVPGYNLEKERLLHERSRKGIYNGDMARDWLDGVKLSENIPVCDGIEWKITPRVTPYTRFEEFSVSGKVSPYDYGLLVDSSGKVWAVAERERATRLDQAFLYSLDMAPASLRGFSRVTSTEGISLVMVSRKGRCINSFKS